MYPLAASLFILSCISLAVWYYFLQKQSDCDWAAICDHLEYLVDTGQLGQPLPVEPESLREQYQFFALFLAAEAYTDAD